MRDGRRPADSRRAPAYLGGVRLRSRLPPAAFALAFAATQVGAQGTPPPLVDSVAPRLESAPRMVPGDPAIRARDLGARTQRYTLTAYREMDEIPVGRLVDEIRVDTIEGRPVLRRVLLLTRGTTQLVDSTWTDLETLAPVAHRALQPTRQLALTFTGRRVRGALTPQDLPPVPIDTLLPVLPFDSGNWDLLARSLPLAIGYAVRFPVYDLDAGLHQYHVAVTGMATLLGEPAWVVTLTLARGRESVVWIGQQSREVLQVETMIGANVLLQQRILQTTAGATATYSEGTATNGRWRSPQR